MNKQLLFFSYWKKVKIITIKPNEVKKNLLLNRESTKMKRVNALKINEINLCISYSLKMENESKDTK